MKKLIIATTILTLAGSATALAQSGGSGAGAGGVGSTANPSSGKNAIGQAPVGHLQPRPIPGKSESSIDKIDPADAALDRKIKSICRGC